MKRMAMLAMLALLPGMTAPGAAGAGGQGHDRHPSPYAGQEAQEIKSLSPADLEELRRGGGWGLAKAAELNGVPGPAHLLELKDEIPLQPGQVAAVEAAFERMRQEAVAEGERLIVRERALEQAFRDRSVTETGLRDMLAEIAESRAALRYVHLAAHLAMLDLLSDAQVSRYNSLRGYGGQRCGTPPAGHDPSMWRRHQGCE